MTSLLLADKQSFHRLPVDRPVEASAEKLNYRHNAKRYNRIMIKSFCSRETEKIWNGVHSKRLPQDIQRIAGRKLRMLNNARSLNDLRVPPANRLEALKGRRSGQQSIRINDQWRICFVWMDGDAMSVENVDYH